VSITDQNRAKSMAAGKAKMARESEAAAASPIGQFKQRMASAGPGGTYDPFANIPAGAVTPTSVSTDETVDLLGEPLPAPTGPAPRIGIGRQDEQKLAALGPEYLAGAKQLASVGTRRPMTATINGQEFSQTPGPSVDRGALEVLARKIAMENLQKRGLEAEARQFGQQQTLARIPGESAIGLAKVKGEFGERDATAQRAFEAPKRDAEIARTQQQVASSAAAEGRTQKTFDESMDPATKQRAAADAMIAQLQEAGVLDTPEGQAVLKVLLPRGTAGRAGADVADPFAKAIGAQGAGKTLAAVQEFTADPQVARLIEGIKSNKQGVFNSDLRSQKQAGDRRALDAYIARYAAAKGVDPQELRVQIESQLAGTDEAATFGSRAGKAIASAATMVPGASAFLR
jgi:hypothetical protein